MTMTAKQELQHANKPRHFWVCWCHLRENERMTSSYLVEAINKKWARDAMRDGEHVVDDVASLAEYVAGYGWVNLTEEQEAEFTKVGRYCLEAGT